ncbi:MAG TPA: hypothetical protein VLL54_20610 [Pyrinomonadaceae bacterium]|nr:hypothetical protein [Pyrinomonadaceae bacterium]
MAGKKTSRGGGGLGEPRGGKGGKGKGKNGDYYYGAQDVVTIALTRYVAEQVFNALAIALGSTGGGKKKKKGKKKKGGGKKTGGGGKKTGAGGKKTGGAGKKTATKAR